MRSAIFSMHLRCVLDTGKTSPALSERDLDFFSWLPAPAPSNGVVMEDDLVFTILGGRVGNEWWVLPS